MPNVRKLLFYALCLEQEVELLTEVIAPRKNLPPLLWKLEERRPERLDYIGVSYGLTGSLLKYGLNCVSLRLNAFIRRRT